jgi:hypothetical protein
MANAKQSFPKLAISFRRRLRFGQMRHSKVVQHAKACWKNSAKTKELLGRATSRSRPMLGGSLG